MKHDTQRTVPPTRELKKVTLFDFDWELEPPDTPPVGDAIGKFISSCLDTVNRSLRGGIARRKHALHGIPIEKEQIPTTATSRKSDRRMKSQSNEHKQLHNPTGSLFSSVYIFLLSLAVSCQKYSMFVFYLQYKVLTHLKQHILNRAKTEFPIQMQRGLLLLRSEHLILHSRA